MSCLLMPVLDAPDVPAKAAYAPPIDANAASRIAVAPTRRRSPTRRRGRLGDRALSLPASRAPAPVAETAGSKPSSSSSSMSSFTGAPSRSVRRARAPVASSDEVDDGEQADPDHFHEVPVVGHDDRRGGLRGGELAQRGADEEEDEGHQAADDVQAVEARGQVEDRPVAGGRDGVAVVDLHPVLVRLAEHEEQAHEEGDDEPAAQLEDVAPLGGEHAPLAGEAGGHEDDRERRRVAEAQLDV